MDNSQFYNMDSNSPYYSPYSHTANYGYAAPPPPQHVPPGGQQQNYGFMPPDQQGMMMNFAKSYGEHLANTGKEQFEKYVSTSRLKNYFAVDNTYVAKKLLRIFFPFLNQDWSVQYTTSEENPTAPRYDVNARDLYIPVMGFVTYLYIAGFALGLMERFYPDQLGLLCSSAIGWLILENFLILMSKYLLGISHLLSFYDILALSAYKYVLVDFVILAFGIGGSTALYAVGIYASIAAAFFLARSIKVEILSSAEGQFGSTRKLKLYFLGLVSLTQPLAIYWLTRFLGEGSVAKKQFIDLPPEYD